MVDDTVVMLELWDTAGQERHAPLVNARSLKEFSTGKLLRTRKYSVLKTFFSLMEGGSDFGILIGGPGPLNGDFILVE